MEKMEMENIEGWKLEQIKAVIVKLMEIMTIQERRRLYRFAVAVILWDNPEKHAEYIKEGYPPIEQTITRTRQLLASATYQQAVKIAAWQRAILRARKKE